ncbi:transcription initiation factor TFIID subunit beta [Aspergillus bombycis]|uniref:Transcription initiation factor TFIID subunit beta n=1 Tax=Aspergillus bombycis TaxID=109264 RepID=A0A1F7ZM85_9EURO|nr:transcription initiation factor TFIID subunit beta [Aspergillus bombycis]OGM40542.1 transcription initiation factor TFIID subunit beta [Aspergillus bombycis]
MSSPPPTNPLKRPSISSSASQPLGTNPKRPRMHPLRQTSFPTTIDADSRAYGAASDAGSVTGSFTGSLGGTSADGVFRNKKRGRKSKAEKEREKEDAARGEMRSSVDAEGSVRAGATGGGGGDDGDDDEDFEDEGELLGREEGATDTEAEKKNLALLVDAFNPLQSERYDLFKRAKLRKETLRRIVNHALSQSVPASVVTTINGFTKVFAGEIIEKARTVQAEWAEAHDQAAIAAFEAEEAATMARAANASAPGTPGPGTPGPGGLPLVKQESSNPSSFPSTRAPGTPVPSGVASPQQSVYGTAQSTRERVFKMPPNPHRGQLLPSHLREALRRWKRDGEGGGVGFSGLSMGNLGVRGSVTWGAGSVGGRRIFR